MPIASVDEYKAYAQISVSTFDVQIGMMLESVQKYIERWCGRTFDKSTYTEFFNGQDSPLYVVKNAPISSITSITKYESPSDTGTVLDSSSYTFNTDETGIVQLTPTAFCRGSVVSYLDIDGADFGHSDSFTDGFRNYKIIYIGGYGSSPATSMPADVRLTMFRLVDSLLEQSGRDATVNSEKLGDYEYYNGQISDAFAYFKGVLAPYRRMSI